MSLYDEVADMMAASWTVGPHATREQIMAALRATYTTEDELRAMMDRTKAAVTQQFNDIEADGGKVIGIAKRL